MCIIDVICYLCFVSKFRYANIDIISNISICKSNYI
nr:MAG TPA: hypothetical protein [Caudoviricetes sp.]